MSVSLSGPPEGVDSSRLDLGLLKARARAVLSALRRSRAELSLALVDDVQMRELNRDHRSIDRPTDVLSFSLLSGEHAEFRGALLGDVVISLETARRQARQRHRSFDEEVTRLLIHGALHLVGHDHEETEERRLMRREERRIWQLLKRQVLTQ